MPPPPDAKQISFINLVLTRDCSDKLVSPVMCPQCQRLSGSPPLVPRLTCHHTSYQETGSIELLLDKWLNKQHRRQDIDTLETKMGFELEQKKGGPFAFRCFKMALTRWQSFSLLSLFLARVTKLAMSTGTRWPHHRESGHFQTFSLQGYSCCRTCLYKNFISTALIC